MVNYYANSTEVLGDNYSIISLECDEYNPNIDGTVTLTVTAKSVYGNPIEDMEIPVTASDGNFTELNGSSITGASTVTGTTDSNGEFTLTYACSEWGLITFSAKNHNTQIRVAGFRKIVENATYSLYVDESTRTAQDFVIPTKYYPKKNCYSLIMRNTTFLFWLWDNGSYGVTNLGNTVQGYNLVFTHEWHY